MNVISDPDRPDVHRLATGIYPVLRYHGRVAAINNCKPTGASESTVLGPFHVADAPELPMGSDICLDAKGGPMLLRGRILDTEGKPVPQAKIDVWQANDEGFHDVQQKGSQPDCNLRGVYRTGADGRCWFRDVKRKFYAIPDDGPVGKLLTAPGRQPCRPAQLHYILEAQGFESLVTHIFDPDEADISSDAVLGVKQSLLAKFDLITDPARIQAAAMSGPFHLVERDFVLAKAK